MQKRTVCKCKIAMSQCHSVSSLDSIPHCIGSEVVAPSYSTAAKLWPVFLLLGMYPQIYGVLSQTYLQKRCKTILPEVVAPSYYTIYSQAVTRVSLRRRATLQGWWASLYVSMPIWVSEGINCCNCYGWSARMFYYNVYALVPAAVKGCCPRAPAVSLLLLLSLRRSPGPTLSPVCKDASPMSTVIAGPYWFCHCHQRWNLCLGK